MKAAEAIGFSDLVICFSVEGVAAVAKIGLAV
jgi:hypothetical protein